MNPKEGVRGHQQQLVVFKLGGEDFGVDIMQVREIIGKEAITPVPNAPPFIMGVMNLRGQITTIIDLRKKLGLAPERGPGLSDKDKSKDKDKRNQERVIVVEDGDGSNAVGVAVDTVTEVTYLADSEIEEVPEMLQQQIGAEYLMGVGKLPDTNKLLILIDLKRMLGSSSGSSGDGEGMKARKV